MYRGAAMPGLQGTYFFADFVTARIWSFRYDGAVMTEFQERTNELNSGLAGSIGNISSFGEDAEGELYIVDYSNGDILKISPAGP